jgi:hypothetical protein
MDTKRRPISAALADVLARRKLAYAGGIGHSIGR